MAKKYVYLFGGGKADGVGPYFGPGEDLHQHIDDGEMGEEAECAHGGELGKAPGLFLSVGGLHFVLKALERVAHGGHEAIPDWVVWRRCEEACTKEGRKRTATTTAPSNRYEQSHRNIRAIEWR